MSHLQVCSHPLKLCANEPSMTGLMCISAVFEEIAEILLSLRDIKGVMIEVKAELFASVNWSHGDSHLKGA